MSSYSIVVKLDEPAKLKNFISSLEQAIKLLEFQLKSISTTGEPTGLEIMAPNWVIEAAFRMIMFPLLMPIPM